MLMQRFSNLLCAVAVWCPCQKSHGTNGRGKNVGTQSQFCIVYVNHLIKMFNQVQTIKVALHSRHTAGAIRYVCDIFGNKLRLGSVLHSI